MATKRGSRIAALVAHYQALLKVETDEKKRQYLRQLIADVEDEGPPPSNGAAVAH